MRHKWSKEDTKSLIKLYPEGSKKELLSLFPNRTWSAIKQRALFVKCSIKDIGSDYRKCNLTPLLNRSIETLYWLGFLVADGHFNKRNRLIVALSAKDHKHLLKLANYLSCSMTICKKVARIACMHSSVIKEIKKRYSISNRKTYEPIKLPKINDREFLAFVIGIIDGDGRLNRQSGARKDCLIQIKMHRSWLDFLNELSCRLSHICGTPMVTAKINSEGYALLSIANSIIVKYLKRKSEKLNLPVLERKWDKVDLSYVSRIEKNAKDMRKVKRCLSKGLEIRETASKTGIDNNTIYRMIRVNPDYFGRTS